METWPNGDKYEGKFEFGKRHHFGTFCFASGDKFVGEFQNNDMNGKGIFSWNDEKRYDGFWK